MEEYSTSMPQSAVDFPGLFFKDAVLPLLDQVSPYLAAAVAYQKGDRVGAWVRVHRIIALSPEGDEKALWANTLKAVMLSDRGEHREAESILRRVIKVRPNFAVAHADLGMALDGIGRHGE